MSLAEAVVDAPGPPGFQAMARFDGCLARMTIKPRSIVRPEPAARFSYTVYVPQVEGTRACPAVHGQVCRWPERAAINKAAGILRMLWRAGGGANQCRIKTPVMEISERAGER